MADRLIDQACDMYCHRIERIEQLGPNARLVFTIPSIDAPGYENVTIKIIVPAETLVTLGYMALGVPKPQAAPELLRLDTEMTIAN